MELELTNVARASLEELPLDYQDYLRVRDRHSGTRMPKNRFTCVSSPSKRRLPGFALPDAVEQIGNEIERAVAWRVGEDVSAMTGQTVRLRFVMKDAELFSYQ